MKPGIEVTIMMGAYGERERRIRLALSARLLRDLAEPLELSSDPVSLYLAGGYRGNDVVEHRRKRFEMREEFAAEISRAIVDALVDHFGENDTMNGYRKDQL